MRKFILKNFGLDDYMVIVALVLRCLPRFSNLHCGCGFTTQWLISGTSDSSRGIRGAFSRNHVLWNWLAPG